MRCAAAIVLVALAVGLSACGQRQACYAPQEQPEFGWQLRLVPCDDGETAREG